MREVYNWKTLRFEVSEKPLYERVRTSHYMNLLERPSAVAKIGEIQT